MPDNISSLIDRSSPDGGRTVRADVEHRLREMILEHAFRPGSHLSDRALCEVFGVSRSVVREAIRTLEGEGLVTIYANRGPFVSTIGIADAMQIYELRGALEGLAGEGFALRASESEREQLHRVFAAICEEEDVVALLRLKQAFYEILLDGCRNVFAKQTLNQYLNRVTQLRLASMSVSGRRLDSIAELRRILTAITNRDAEGAAIACRDHVRSAAAVAVRTLREAERSDDDRNTRIISSGERPRARPTRSRRKPVQAGETEKGLMR